MNYAVWESVVHFRTAFNHPDFKEALERYPSSAVAILLPHRVKFVRAHLSKPQPTEKSLESLHGIAKRGGVLTITAVDVTIMSSAGCSPKAPAAAR